MNGGPAHTAAAPTVRAALESAAAALARSGDECPDAAAAWLVAATLECRRPELALRARETLRPRQAEALAAALARICAGEPVQYVLGEWEFRGLALKVDRRALIPRPETEQLVGFALACGQIWREPDPLVADVGTGCGCIAIALAVERPAARIEASDLSAEALALASENARRHGVAGRIAFRLRDMLDGAAAGSFDAVISNPPYVPTADLDGLAPCVRDHEPRIALDGGRDGLCHVRTLAEQAARALKPGGRLFLEIGAGQAPAAAAILRTAGFGGISVLPDLAGLPRVLEAAAESA